MIKKSPLILNSIIIKIIANFKHNRLPQCINRKCTIIIVHKFALVAIKLLDLRHFPLRGKLFIGEITHKQIINDVIINIIKKIIVNSLN